MSNLPVNKRQHHCFISYASEDAVLAKKLAEWMDNAGLKVWFDEKRMKAGAPVIDELTRQIWSSRAFLLLLTEAALKKDYVKHEVDIGCEQQITARGFALIGARTNAKLDPKERFPALAKVSWMDIPNGDLDIGAASRLLQSLTPGVPQAPEARHLFVSCGWGGENEDPVTTRVCTTLATRGVRLIGDARDQENFAGEGKTRVERIMSGCTGHLMILPERKPPNKTPEESYKYFLAEWEISRRLRLARRIFCVSRSVLPAQLQCEAIEIGTAENPAQFEPELIALYEETEPVAPYAFLSTDYTLSAERNDDARQIVEHVLGMRCYSGCDYAGEQVTETIIDMIRGANLVFADLAAAQEGESKRLRVNVNTCIEAGVAKGARRAVFVTALHPGSFDPTATEITRQLPFMFRNNQIHWYSSPAHYLAKIHRLAMGTRRRIINDELPAAT